MKVIALNLTTGNSTQGVSSVSDDFALTLAVKRRRYCPVIWKRRLLK